ncbi:DUF397 domain-containing protein [Streptomyces sp. NPDC093085]|uniref:DUF397 domain-containing protein n=1 Tax=Streptomyces sp. NPDC093085 TaxID=3155068 RepID=UPI00341E7542
MAERIKDASTLSGWRKSSFSGAQQGDCVEVTDGYAGAVPVRDSKVPHGPALLFAPGAWAGFVGGVQQGGFLS